MVGVAVSPAASALMITMFLLTLQLNCFHHILCSYEHQCEIEIKVIILLLLFSSIFSYETWTFQNYIWKQSIVASNDNATVIHRNAVTCTIIVSIETNTTATINITIYSVFYSYRFNRNNCYYYYSYSRSSLRVGHVLLSCFKSCRLGVLLLLHSSLSYIFMYSYLAYITYIAVWNQGRNCPL